MKDKLLGQESCGDGLQFASADGMSGSGYGANCGLNGMFSRRDGSGVGPNNNDLSRWIKDKLVWLERSGSGWGTACILNRYSGFTRCE